MGVSVQGTKTKIGLETSSDDEVRRIIVRGNVHDSVHERVWWGYPRGIITGRIAATRRVESTM